jgi:CRISPR-associated protein Csd1
MMLQALCELARRQHLVEDPALEQRPLDFVLRLDAKGKLLALVPTQDDSGHPQRFAQPRAPKRARNILATPLADNAKYVLGVQAAKEGREVNEALLKDRVDAFATVFTQVCDGVRDLGLDAMAAFVSDIDSARKQVFAVRPEGEWTGSENLAFQLDGDSDLIHQRPNVLARLRALSERAMQEGAQGQCLITGRRGPIARLHPGIKRIPGGQTSGAAVVSFNESAFASYGLSQGQNAPVGALAAQEYTTALNWLLEPFGGRRHRYGVEVGNAVLVFWCRESTETADLVASLFDPSPGQLEKQLSSPFDGVSPPDMAAEPFYALSMSAHSRVIVRDWLEETTAHVQKNLRQYWDDLNLVGGDGKPRPIWSFLKSIESKAGQGLSPGLAGKLLISALRGSAFPAEILTAALRRLRLPTGNYDRQQVHDRCSLIKALLNRRFRASLEKELTVSLDESCKESPYLLGRLFAVIERLQGLALGDVNASIRDKFFGSASARPALVFPRLLQLSVHHAAKAQGSGWLEKIKSGIVGALPSQRFPATLGLEDQGLFAIGYYHQREDFFKKRES